MIVWGGGIVWSSLYYNDGAKYNPSTDSWQPITTTNAPSVRGRHSAVWSGSEMFIWGGVTTAGSFLNTGGKYNPATNTWSIINTANAPSARDSHHASWTGSKMLIWAGGDNTSTNTGGLYDPAADSWVTTATLNGPPAVQFNNTVWTGTELLNWFSWSTPYTSLGHRFNPTTISWQSLPEQNALFKPKARIKHAAFWTGTDLLIWGGISSVNIPVIYNDGAKYNLATDKWTPISNSNAPSSRINFASSWTGTDLLIWGGYNSSTSSYLNSGYKYNSTADTWTALSGVNAPTARDSQTSVWTGSEMIIWGGKNSGGNLNTGAKYNPATDTWTTLSTVNAPTARYASEGVWAGTVMIVWGGATNGNVAVNTGAIYNPTTNSWSSISSTNVPSARYGHKMIWTGADLIIWGGQSNFTTLASGAGYKYNLATDTWTSISTINAPEAQIFTTVNWTGSEMIVWGGSKKAFGPSYSDVFATGARYNPTTDTWTAIRDIGTEFKRRFYHSATWTGTKLLIWGGSSDNSETMANGIIYKP